MDNFSRLIGSVENVCEGGHIAYKNLYPTANKQQVKVLSISAGIISEIVDYYKDNSINFSDYGPVNAVSLWLKAHKNEFSGFQYLPLNPLVLMRKIRAFGVYGAPLNKVIKLPRKGNQNRVKQSEGDWWCILVHKMLTGRHKYTNEQIYTDIMSISMELGFRPPGNSRLRTFLRRTKSPDGVSGYTESLGYNDLQAIATISGASYESVFQELTAKTIKNHTIRLIAKDYYNQREAMIGQLTNKYRK